VANGTLQLDLKYP